MVVTMGALAVISILSAGLAADAVHLNGTSGKDRNSKRALAAAEAGLRAAAYRANKLAPTNVLCVTDVVQLPIVGECPAFSENLGNGASYTYYVTPVLNTSDACAGLPIQYDGDGGLTIVQRCVTSTGTVNGVKRRLQTRLAAFQGVPLFPVGGMVGLDSVTLDNSSTVAGGIGSNGLIKLGNSNSVSGNLEIGPSAPEPSIGNSTTTGPTVRRTTAQGPFVLAPVDVGNSATVNDNVRISNGLQNPKVNPYDASSNVTLNTGTRVLTLGNSSSLTLSGGTYNFCDLIATNSAQITVAIGAKVRIFIDSPDRSGSGCPPGTGRLEANNSITFSNPSGVPENLQLYVYGWNNGQNVVDFKNSVFINGTIYAPQSKVLFKNSAQMTGGLAAKSIEFKNSINFTWVPSLGDLRARTLTLYHRTAWHECRREPTNPADPESGCG